MPSGRDDDDDRRAPRRRDGAEPTGGRGGRARSDRARRADSDRKGDGRPRRDDERRGGARGRSGAARPPGDRRDRDRSERGERAPSREPRGPRPPIKGKRRTFDVDSAPNERERARAAADATPSAPADEQWIDEGPVREAADRAVRRGGASAGRRPKARAKGTDSTTGDRNAGRRRDRAAKRAEHALELDRGRLERQLGAAKASRLLQRLGEASDAFADDRYDDARKLLRPLVDQVPTEPALRELYGLTLYRLGSWKKAMDELEEFVRLTRSTEQHPVLADCHRALGRHERVEELWEDLAAASPAAALVAEGRIVYSGSLADQGRLADAIAVLEDGALGSKSLKLHHLRMRYALADLYDRAGEQQAARRYFESVAATDPQFFDVADRLRQL